MMTNAHVQRMKAIDTRTKALDPLGQAYVLGFLHGVILQAGVATVDNLEQAVTKAEEKGRTR